MTRDQLEAVVWQHASNLDSVDPQDRADAMTAILDAAFPPEPPPEAVSAAAEAIAGLDLPGLVSFSEGTNARIARAALMAAAPHLAASHAKPAPAAEPAADPPGRDPASTTGATTERAWQPVTKAPAQGRAFGFGPSATRAR